MSSEKSVQNQRSGENWVKIPIWINKVSKTEGRRNEYFSSYDRKTAEKCFFPTFCTMSLTRCDFRSILCSWVLLIELLATTSPKTINRYHRFDRSIKSTRLPTRNKLSMSTWFPRNWIETKTDFQALKWWFLILFIINILISKHLQFSFHQFE